MSEPVEIRDNSEVNCPNPCTEYIVIGHCVKLEDDWWVFQPVVGVTIAAGPMRRVLKVLQKLNTNSHYSGE